MILGCWRVCGWYGSVGGGVGGIGVLASVWVVGGCVGGMRVLAGLWVAWGCRRVCGWHGRVGGCVGVGRYVGGMGV